jgi:hypothetical protein
MTPSVIGLIRIEIHALAANEEGPAAFPTIRTVRSTGGVRTRRQ